MSLPKISIVIPSYNQGIFLEETLLSVIEQAYPRLEVFVVDGGSSDNSVEIIKKYADKISWWVSEKDTGQSEAINKGLKKTTGEIVSWVNSDDLLVPGSLQAVASVFSSAPEKTGLVHGGAIVFEAGKTTDTIFSYQVLNKEAYLGGMVFPQPAAFFRRSWLDKTGLLNESLHYGMDYDLFQRLSLLCDFLPMNKVLAKYRLHQQSKSVAENNRFISDWKKSFVNMCKNLQWTEELSYLLKTSLFNNEAGYYQSFSFQPDQDILSAVNKRKVLFFQLGHILKDLYWNGQLQQAKALRKIMKKDFEQDWWKEDPRLMAADSKLNYPGFALTIFKTIKRLIGSG